LTLIGSIRKSAYYCNRIVAEAVAHVARPGKVGAVLLDFTEQGEGQ
jgi:hypothetical protein